MKKLIFGLLSIGLLMSTASAITFFDNTSTVYTKSEQDAVTSSDVCAVDPLRCGMNNPGSKVQGLYYKGPITSVYQAQNTTLAYVHNLINRALSLLGLVALCYLLYGGFIIVTGAGDDAKTKKGWQKLRTAALAIGGVAMSRLLVSFIVYLIDILI